MARSSFDDIGRWLDDTAQAAIHGTSRRRVWARPGRDVSDAARAFVGAARGLDRRSVKAFSRRLADDAELRQALGGLTAAMKDLPAEAPARSRTVARRATRRGGVGKIAALAAAAGILALIVRTALRRRNGAPDPAAVFDAHISSHNGHTSQVPPEDAEVTDPG